MDQEKIGMFIAELRKEKNLTQEKLGEKLGVTSKAVSKWENGKSMPDISIMKDLCDTLEITLNELFVGEKIKEKDIQKVSENNLLNILKLEKIKKNKQKILLISFILIIIFLIGRFTLIKYGFIYDDDLKYTKIYINDSDDIKGDVDTISFGKIDKDFDIGANKYGIAVFKNPKEAFKTLKKKYKKGINLIKKEFNLPPLSNFTYKVYKTYGWQVTKGSKKEKEEALFITKFLDIYENSFN